MHPEREILRHLASLTAKVDRLTEMTINTHRLLLARQLPAAPQTEERNFELTLPRTTPDEMLALETALSDDRSAFVSIY